jgi:cell division protein FtsA
VVAEVDEYGEVSVTGVGEAPSDGLRKGVVVNLDRTARSIRSAVDQAERMSGVRIESVVVGVAGSHIASQNSHGLISVARSDREIGAEEVQRVLEAARAVELPADRELLHVIPRAFTVDGQAGVRDAIGLSGARLEVDTHIVTGSAAAVQNVVKAVHQAGLNLDDLVLQGLASSEAVLSDSEAELGAAVVDIGAGTTDVVVYAQGAVLHTAVIPVGGNHVTSDIAIGLRTSLGDAESMKINYGHAVSDAIESEELVEVRQGGGEQVTAVSRRLLADVIGPRARETFGLVQQEIRRRVWC